MKRKTQLAQAMVEFLIIIPVLILLIFGAVQVAFIYSAKTGLNYATFQTARIGAVRNAQYDDMWRGLQRGMYPMFSQIEDPKLRMEFTAEEVRRHVVITRVSPSTQAFSDWAVEHSDPLRTGESKPAIPNDNLMFRSPYGGTVSIQDANLLKIRVSYCMKLIVPIVDRLLSSGSRFVDRQRADKKSAQFSEISKETYKDFYGEICGSRKDGFIITAEATVRMQSPAVDDEKCNDGKYMICP